MVMRSDILVFPSVVCCARPSRAATSFSTHMAQDGPDRITVGARFGAFGHLGAAGRVRGMGDFGQTIAGA